MEFKRKDPTCKFSVPDRPTVKQQLEYFSLAVGTPDKDLMFRHWEGAQALIQSWNCKSLPDQSSDIDQLDDPDITQVIIWAGMAVRGHMNSLDVIPKNS